MNFRNFIYEDIRSDLFNEATKRSEYKSWLKQLKGKYHLISNPHDKDTDPRKGIIIYAVDDDENPKKIYGSFGFDTNSIISKEVFTKPMKWTWPWSKSKHDDTELLK